MTPDNDDLDPSDWLAAQFGEEPLKPAVPATPPAALPSVAPPPVVPDPTLPPYQAPAYQAPAYQAPPANAPPPYQPPPIVAPEQGFPVGQTPAPTPSWQLSADPPAAPPPAAPQPNPIAAPQPDAGGFSWGLTPGAEPAPAVAPADPYVPLAPFTPPPLQQPDPSPVFPPLGEQQPAPSQLGGQQPAPPQFGGQPGAPAPDFGQQPPPAAFPGLAEPQPQQPPFPIYGQPAGEQPTPALPAFGQAGTEQPTTAFPTFGQPAAEHPTSAFPAFGEYPGQSVEPVPVDPSRWLAAPLDPALDGVTEVLEAELVGLTGPQGEGVGASALDDLFGDNQFRDFSDEPFVTVPPRQGGGGAGGSARVPKAPRADRAPIPRNQRILMIVAGALVAALALVALFAIGMKLASLRPAPALAATPSPSASAAPAVLPLGPVKPGDYHWDQLLGGECLKSFDSAWQDEYTVVDCTTPHPAQLVYRGVFTDPASATYPGIAELQKRINLLCTAPSIINYAVAGVANDIQVLASYAADESDWDSGNHSYFCFVNRSGGTDLGASVAVPQVAPTPPASAVPTGAATPGAEVKRGHAKGVKP